MKDRIQIGIGDSTITAKGFIEAWKRAEKGERVKAEERLDFENLETLLKTLTQARWVLLKTLRTAGPMSVRALSSRLGRDYKNVHTDVRRLEQIGLVDRDKDGKVKVPWTIVEAKLRLAA
jgi:predicted transcriptional regulator